MIIAEQTLGILVVVALAAVAVLTVAVVVLALRLRRLGTGSGASAEDADLDVRLRRQASETAALREDVHMLADNVEYLRELQAGAVSQVGVVRYDAFDDMGGALSFTVALLDERGSGLVLSAINGRQETRCYAKPVREGTSRHDLSREEREALAVAREDGPADEAVVRPRRRAS